MGGLAACVRGCAGGLLAAMLLAMATPPALGQAQSAGVSVPLMLAPHPERQGFVRIVNKTDQSGTVRITAVDDAGNAAEPIEVRLAASQALHFNSEDLANGNAAKGIARIGEPGRGHWRLRVETALADVRVLAFVRTRDGFLTAMHDTLPRDAQGRILAEVFNPGSNSRQASSLRLVNTGANSERVSIAGVDDQGASAGPVALTLAAGQSRTISAFDLEEGASGLTGTLGDGAGKWRLTVTAGQSVVGMSLLETPTGPITNLSTAGVPAAAMTGTPTDDDHGDGFADATNLAIDGRQSGRIDPAGDQDYFRVRVAEAGTLTVWTTGDLDTRGYLYDANERQLASNDDGSASDGGNFRIQREVEAGTYYVRVEAYVRSATGDYAVHAELETSTAPAGDDHGDSFADATNLAIGGRQSGAIDPAGDEDYFRVRVSESGTLTVYATGSMDNRGYLYDGNERQLASNDDGGQGYNFRIRREVDAGTYYVMVKGYSSSTTGSYAVHAEFEASTPTNPPTDPEPPATEGPYGAYALGDPILRCWAGYCGGYLGDTTHEIVHGSNQFSNWVNETSSYGDISGSDTQAEADRLALDYCNNMPDSAHIGRPPPVEGYEGGPNNCSIVGRYGRGQCLVYAHDVVRTREIRPHQEYEHGYVHHWAIVNGGRQEGRQKADELETRCEAESRALHYEGAVTYCRSSYRCLD